MTQTADGTTTNVVTSMHRGGYDLYGRRMIADFLDKWPENTRLTVYAEDFEVAERSDRLEVIDLHAACPDLVAFKENNRERWKRGYVANTGKRLFRSSEKYRYKWDAVKFANKVYAYCAHAQRTQARFLVWLDADTTTVRPVPADFIQSLGDVFLVYLGRRYVHSECGFLRFDMRHDAAPDFFANMRAMYDSGQVFTLKEWHDSFVFDTVRSVMTASGKISELSLSDPAEMRHPFVNSVLGEYMDHLKGETRKTAGSSSDRDRGRETVSRRIMRKLHLATDV